jgi:ATP-dependent helicase/nuclease subunit A
MPTQPLSAYDAKCIVPLFVTDAFLRLNDEQKQALDWTRSIAVRANAGSGKTTVLVQRILQILNAHRDLTLDRIVAITFTRKAGAQLQQKLHEALSACVAVTSGDESAFWLARLDELTRCPIGTIDSLCHRLLHRGIEAGLVHDLDPAFGILDSIDSTELTELAIRQTEIETKNPQHPAHLAWETWLRDQGRDELLKALKMLLEQSVEWKPHDEGEKWAEIDAVRLLNLKELVEPLTAMAEKRSSLSSELADALEQIQQSDRSSGKNVVEVIDFLKNTIENYDKFTDFELVCDLRANLFTKGEGTIRKQGLSSGDKIYFPHLHAIQMFWSQWMTDWNYEPCALDGFEQARDLCAIHSVALRHFRELCRLENKYDFNFLAGIVGQMLANPKHARYITHDYRFILVDEFQDTNEPQWQIVARLAAVDPSKPVTSDKLMIVGDPQQSIYRFRQADTTVFERIINLIQDGNREADRTTMPTACDHLSGITQSTDEQRSGLMRLRKNYRSYNPLPLQLINRLSDHALTEVGASPQSLEPGGLPPDPNAEVVYLFPESTVSEDDANTASNEYTDTEIQTESLDDQQLELVAIELHNQHSKGIRWGRMAILLRSRTTHFLNLETVLRNHGIPYQLVGGLGFWQRQEVRDLVGLANCLANGADDLSLFAVLRGPLCGLDDSELLLLSMLGGRRLLAGLDRVVSALDDGDDFWSQLRLDNATVIQTAIETIVDDRKAVLRRAYERLGTDGAWRIRVDRMPHGELLRLAIDESCAWAIYTDGEEGERRLANLRLFFDEVRQLESDRSATLAETARRLKTLVDESSKDEQAELTAPEHDAVQVMTVHAAKGLEYEVVAIVGLERRFHSESDPVFLLDRFQHIRADVRECELAHRLHGMPVVRFRNPENPLEKVRPLLHQAIGEMEWLRTNEEESRIFHVAITRAEKVLILAGQAPKGKSWPPKNSWQKWVHDALTIANDIKEGTHNIDGLPLRVVRNVIAITPKDSTETTVTSGPLDLDPINEAPRRRTIAATALFDMLKMYDEKRDQWEMRYLNNVAPRMGGIANHLVEGIRKDVGKDVGKLVGTLVHRALEMGEAFPGKAVDRHSLLLAHATMLLREHGLDPEESGGFDRETTAGILPEFVAKTSLDILKDVLPNNPFRDLLDAEGESEVNFAIPIGDWVVTGRFDRLIIQGNNWEIVDWKTDSGQPDAIKHKYADQMKIYALALLESLPEIERPAEVSVHLAMTSARESQILKYSATDLIAFRKQLETNLVKCTPWSRPAVARPTTGARPAVRS